MNVHDHIDPDKTYWGEVLNRLDDIQHAYENIQDRIGKLQAVFEQNRMDWDFVYRLNARLIKIEQERKTYRSVITPLVNPDR